MDNGNGRVIKGRDRTAGRRSAHESLKSTWPFIFLHCPSLTTYLSSKTGWGWIPPKFANALLRGIAQVLFANNPFTGLLVLTGLIWWSWILGGIVVASSSVAILTAFILKQNADVITGGLVSFNAVLLGSVTVCLWKPLYDKDVDIKICLFILVGSVFSILMYNGLSNVFSSFRPPIPVLSVPFHAIVLTLFACLKPELTEPGEVETSSSNHFHNDSNASSSDNQTFMDFRSLDYGYNLSPEDYTEFYSWRTLQNVLYTLPLYSSQVFGFPDPYAGLIMYAGMLLYSPLLTVMCIYGGLVSTAVALFLIPFPDELIFIGVYGFNGFLAGGAITLFFVFNRYCFFNVTANAVFTTVIQASITDIFAKWQMPVFGLPFLLSTAIFVSVTGDDKGNGQKQHFIRLEGTTFPELDRKKYYASIRSINHHEEDEENAAGRNLMNSTQ